MADKIKFKVLRRHEGDRMYEEGDIREGSLSDLGHLVPRVLEHLGPAEKSAEKADEQKAEPAPANKAEPAPANKSEDHSARSKRR